MLKKKSNKLNYKETNKKPKNKSVSFNENVIVFVYPFSECSAAHIIELRQQEFIKMSNIYKNK